MNDYSANEPSCHCESASDTYIKALTVIISALAFLAATISIYQAESSSEATAEMILLLEEVVENTNQGRTLAAPPEIPSIVQV